MRRKICVVTGSRSEYGLLYWLMKEIQDDHDMELQVVVTGMHLSPEFGMTYKMIEQDNFNISAKVEMLMSSDSPSGVTKSIGLGLIGFADMLDRLNPDIVTLMGDRYEIMAAAQASMVARIPIAHISGGELSEGSIDDAMRHSITKMSNLHFVAAGEYRRRVIQLGENPKYVFNFGEPGLDNINRLELLSRKELEKAIEWNLGSVNFLVTYHPVTLSDTDPEYVMKELFLGLDSFPEAKIIFTRPNSDSGGRKISRLIDEYAADQADRVKVFTSLGHLKYLSAVKHVDVIIGNSSSGLVEVPAMKKPSINIGNRQQGRLKASSIIDCDESSNSIEKAVRRALTPVFQQSLGSVVSLYGSGNASALIKNKLKTIDLEGILLKKFFDIPANL